MTLLHLLSDVHTEWSGFKPEDKPWDKETILLLAGDVGVAKKPRGLKAFMDSVSPQFRHVFYIPGNHEYYGGGSLVSTDDKLEKLCEEYQNVTYLNNKTVEMDGVCFIGTTLWTDFAGHLKDNDTGATKLNALLYMNDYSNIRTGTQTEPYRRKAAPNDMEVLNLQARTFLENALQKACDDGLKKVVLTHHAPLHTQMKEHDELWPCYYNTGLEYLFERYHPDVWAHGHTHKHVDAMVNNTRLLCNTRDYNTYENTSNPYTYKRDLLVKI